MSLIPEITVEQLQRLENLRIPSVVILDDNGEYIGTLIIPPPEGGMTIYDDIKTNAEYLGVRSNSVLPQADVNSFAVEMDVQRSTTKFEPEAKAKPKQKRKRKTKKAKK